MTQNGRIFPYPYKIFIDKFEIYAKNEVFSKKKWRKSSIFYEVGKLGKMAQNGS
jgi:hypothetical protein